VCSSDLLREPTLQRLVRYHQFSSALPPGEEKVLSSRMCECAGVDSTSVRRDLAAIGVRGRTSLGYRKTDVLRAIEAALGMGRAYRAVIVGAGRLGCALASYPFYAPSDLAIVALLYVDPAKFGLRVNGIPVEPFARLRDHVRRHGIALAMVAVPADAAQDAATLLVQAGVRAIWNFSPASLRVPREVFVRHEQLSLGLGVVTHYLERHARTCKGAPPHVRSV
jgi:redox-sensing transcriptional repressor